ncbi:nucleotide-binding universal stress UspA family protein [Streptacidiphilus sp. MAP12-33]|uniref:universal stress protein n=1 Tax=Streptacidiphilus sp. MAP12-33 TaxID=3156266 RepID=UPI003512C69F
MSLPLTVAFDGSETAAAAARWAAAYAAATGAPVRLLHVRPPLDQGPEPLRPRRPDVEIDATDAMARTAAELSRVHPGLPIDATTQEGGDVADLLCRAADRAGTLVLGTRGAGPAALVLGSVALAVASRAESPVVLVPPGTAGAPPDREVLVGVDLAGDCGPVLSFGFEQARCLGVRLHALHVWRAAGALSAAVHAGPGADPREVEGHVLSTELAAVQAFFPGVEAVSEEHDGVPAWVLPPATEKASLLVLGRRRRRTPPARLGPVVPAVLGRTACPVAVVPHR